MELFVYGLLIFTSIVGLTFIVERGLALRWARVVPKEIEAAVESCQTPEDVPMLRRVCQQHDSALSRLLLVAADHLSSPRADAADVVQTRARREITRLERGLVVLEIIVGIAPLLGLVGTIYGLITLFQHMGPTENHAEFASGIGLALRATLLGLLIAIPALVAWSYYSKKVETLSVEMESLCDEFLRKHYRTEQAAALEIAAGNER